MPYLKLSAHKLSLEYSFPGIKTETPSPIAESETLFDSLVGSPHPSLHTDSTLSDSRMTSSGTVQRLLQASFEEILTARCSGPHWKVFCELRGIVDPSYS